LRLYGAAGSLPHPPSSLTVNVVESLSGPRNAVAVPNDAAPTDALSVDVEDYFHVEAFADQVSPDRWASFPSRLRRNCERILALFDRHQCRATFFILGWVAEHHPDIVREIAAAGHELACHSYAHRRVISLRPDEFREDLRRARDVIEDVAGVRVLGYRAPTFSIMRRSLWAMEILAEEGFAYDSSIFPIRHDLYGYPEFPRFLQRVQLPSGREIVEVPMSTIRVGGMNWPVGGGGYLRILPMNYTRWAIRRLHERDRQPVVLYLHPWEIDPGQPRLQGKWKSRFRHYFGLSTMEPRLEDLLGSGRFEPMGCLVKRLRTSAPSIVAAIPPAQFTRPA
jgi:polysaccharide deacetylase family protein (PEP-CTERM system associated)